LAGASVFLLSVVREQQFASNTKLNGFHAVIFAGKDKYAGVFNALPLALSLSFERTRALSRSLSLFLPLILSFSETTKENSFAGLFLPTYAEN